MIFHENRLPADDSHEISCLICYFWISGKIWNCHPLQIIGGALRVKCLTFSGAFTIPELKPNWKEDPKVHAAIAKARVPVKSWNWKLTSTVSAPSILTLFPLFTTTVTCSLICLYTLEAYIDENSTPLGEICHLVKKNLPILRCQN